MSEKIKIIRLNPVINPITELVLNDEYDYKFTLEPNYSEHNGISGIDRVRERWSKSNTFNPFFLTVRNVAGTSNSIALNMEQIEALEQAIKEMKTYIKGDK